MSILEDDLALFYMVTALSFYSAMIPTLVSLLLNIFIWDSQVETSLKRQVSDLKEELGTVCMTDEFAKYSKIQRKLNKATDELHSKNQSQMIYQNKTKLILYIILYAILIIGMVTINWKYYYKPIITLSENTLYPIGFILGFPTGQNNCFSVWSWTFISGYVFRLFIQNIS